MANKNYNLTQQPNFGVKDDAPDWMNSLFEKKKEQSNDKKFPFEGIKDPILNPKGIGVDKKRTCSKCGTILSSSNVSVCSNCI